MTATIYWAPTGEANVLKGVSGPSSFIKAMEETFGPRPWHLTEEHEPLLRAMGNAYDSDQNPYRALAGILSLRKSIKVWPEY